MSGRPKHPKYARNKNVIVIGGSGSGKTRFFVKPNLMQMPEKVSYVCTDPKGTIIIECGKMLSDAGYKIKVLNTINFKKSMHYNPFHYIRSEKDILKLVNTIIANTKGTARSPAKISGSRQNACSTAHSSAISTMKPRRKNRTSPRCWNLSMPAKPARMMKSSRIRSMNYLRIWRRRNRNTLPCGSIKSTSWRQVKRRSPF